MKQPAAQTTKQADFFPEANPSHPTNQPAKFHGTDNPRHLRALEVLLRRPVPREQLDSVAGCSNGPALVADLRALGLGEPRVFFHGRCPQLEIPRLMVLLGHEQRIDRY